ncbi:MAG: hypothetical protein L6435_02950 [Anaerolineae bacterium]|nr:hypothetical protein [Anaerolineae bacterium]
MIGFSGVRNEYKTVPPIFILLHLVRVRLTSSYLQADDSLTSGDGFTLRASKGVCGQGDRV